MSTPNLPPTLYLPIRCCLATDTSVVFENASEAARHFGCTRKTIDAKLRRGELLYWHEERWLTPEEYRASEMKLAKLRKAPMIRHKQANNWFNKKMKRNAVAMRNIKQEAMNPSTAVECFFTDNPSVLFPSMTAACKSAGVSAPTGRKWLEQGLLKQGKPTELDFQKARGEVTTHD
ncbi:hypothetical protein JXVLWARM_CDS_0079 [Burkholderia phage Bm1]